MGLCFSNCSETRVSKRSHPMQCSIKHSLNLEKNIEKIESTFTIRYNDDELNTKINELIKKYNTSYKIGKINYEQLYNLFLNYKFDFTNSNYIIVDTRKQIIKTKQYFLNKFPKINYSIDEFNYLNHQRKSNLLNFIKNKTVIFILDNIDSLISVEKYISFTIINNNANNILILTQFIEEYNDTRIENTFKEHLYHFIEEDIFYDYIPSILLNAKDIKSYHINNKITTNNSFVFINLYSNENNFDIKYLCNKDIDENDIYYKFITKFKIFYILNISLAIKDEKKNNKINNNIVYHESKRKKTNNEEKKEKIVQVSILCRDDINFNAYFEEIKNEFNQIMEDLINQIVSNNCVLIQFNEQIDNLIRNKFIFYIVNKITGLSFEKSIKYFKCNFLNVLNKNSDNDKEISNFISNQ